MKKRTLKIFGIGVLLVVFLLFFLGGGWMLFLDFGKISDDTAATSSVNYKEAYNGTGIPETIPQEVLDKYLKLLAPADDEHDFLYATDYSELNLVQEKIGRDQSAYESIFGYSNATLEDIKQALERNPNISQTYKEFIYQYACDLRRLYPDINLAVLRYNLETLVIDELTQEQIDKETLSTDSAACYLRYENRICVLEDLDLSRDSDDFIILTHELCHAARTAQTGKDHTEEFNVDVAFNDTYNMGTYAEEGLITNLAYELQGLDNKAIFYPVLASYYRIICSCIDYSGEDFFNHSVNYLIDRMDAFMGDEEYAYQIVAMIDAQMILRYTPHQSVDFHDFQPLYDYLAKMYFKKNIHAGMTYPQAEAVFQDFYEEITFNFENMNRKFNITEETFLPAFETYIADLGIQS